MMADDARLREVEALTLLTNRILMDFLSLQVDSGQRSLEEMKKIIGFSANEVVRGSSGLETEIRFFERALVDRFDHTFAGNGDGTDA